MLFFFNINGHVVTGQKPQTVSTINFTSPNMSNDTNPGPATTSTTDAIGIAMNNVRSDNMDNLLNQTITPFMDKPTSMVTTATSENQTQGEGEINQPILTSNSDMVTGNNDQTHTAIDDSASPDPATQVNNPMPFTDNQTVLLQFQHPADSDIINKLQRIENMANEQAAVVENATNAATKSVQESNNRVIQNMSAIRSSINGSTNGDIIAINNLTDRITSMQESNNKIIQDMSELKSYVKKPFSSYISPTIMSGIVAAIVSSIVILLFLHASKTDVGVKFNELKFRKKYR
jgi:hypothetical protein